MAGLVVAEVHVGLPEVHDAEQDKISPPLPTAQTWLGSPAGAQTPLSWVLVVVDPPTKAVVETLDQYSPSLVSPLGAVPTIQIELTPVD